MQPDVFSEPHTNTTNHETNKKKQTPGCRGPFSNWIAKAHNYCTFFKSQTQLAVPG
eukprot:m.259527 g.259527  ORF g.259527 m.259527 type:complete len:56 (+) comp38205_c0_seq1:1114-1281(+)